MQRTKKAECKGEKKATAAKLKRKLVAEKKIKIISVDKVYKSCRILRAGLIFLLSFKHLKIRLAALTAASLVPRLRQFRDNRFSFSQHIPVVRGYSEALLLYFWE